MFTLNKKTPTYLLLQFGFPNQFFCHSVFENCITNSSRASVLQLNFVKMQSAVSCVLCVLIAATFVCAANATYCRAPPNLRHGSHSGRGQRFFRAGSTVTYRCNRGYRLHGWRSTVCYYSRWKGAYWAKPAPLCIRKDLAYLA